MGADVPDDVIIVGVEAERIYDFSDEISTQVSAAIPAAAQAVLSVLGVTAPLT
jgi:Ni,Fe-hydrogenase maturation factor